MLPPQNKTTTQQLPQLRKQTKKKGLKKLAVRPDTRVPQSPQFSLEPNPTPQGMSPLGSMPNKVPQV